MHPLLINEAPLQVLPSLAQAIGLNEALILQQIHYWLNPNHNKNLMDGRYWVYNTYEQWQAQFPFWCPRTIRSAMNKLEETGLVITFVKQNDFRKIKHYSINYAVLDKVQANLAVPESFIASEPENETMPPGEEEESIQEMLTVWNDTVQSQLLPGQPAILTPKRTDGFVTLRAAFAKRGLSWRAYCKKVATTRFLMGENTSGFKVTLDWALNFNNACKVLEGGIYDKPAPTTDKPVSHNDDWTTLAEEIKTFLPINTYTQDWLKVCQHLVKTIGASTFRSWFLQQVHLVSINGDTATLAVGSNFRKAWLYNHYHDQLKAALCQVYPSINHIEFQLLTNPAF
jgi:hypothetical protein